MVTWKITLPIEFHPAANPNMIAIVVDSMLGYVLCGLFSDFERAFLNTRRKIDIKYWGSNFDSWNLMVCLKLDQQAFSRICIVRGNPKTDNHSTLSNDATKGVATQP